MKNRFFQNPFEKIHGLIHGLIRIYPKWLTPSGQPCMATSRTLTHVLTSVQGARGTASSVNFAAGVSNVDAG